MKDRRNLLPVNLIALLVLLALFLIGWREGAAVGLVVLVMLDLSVVLRGRQPRSLSALTGNVGQSNTEEQAERMEPNWPQITYEQALDAFQANQKLHLGGRIYLVRPTLREPEDGPVLWITDERTLGDHGLLLFPDGRVKAKQQGERSGTRPE